MFQNKITNLFNRSASNSYNAVKITGYLDDYIVKGQVFSIEILVNFTIATPVKFHADLSAVGSDSKSLFLLPLLIHPTDGYITVQLYKNPEGVSGGSSITPVNRNQNSDNTALSVVTMGVSTTSDGTALPLERIFGTDASGSNSGSGEGNKCDSLILNTDDEYLWVLTPSETNTSGIIAEFGEVNI